VSAAREEILRRVRAALGDARPQPAPIPAYRRAGTLAREARVDLFAERVADYRAEVRRGAGVDDIVAGRRLGVPA